MPSTRAGLTIVILALASLGAAAAAALQPGRDRSPLPQQPGKALPRDVAPMEHRLSAYHFEGSIVVVATGANRTGGYQTELKLVDADAKPPKLTLSNVPPMPGMMAAQAITPFDATAYFPAERSVKKVTVTVAGRPETVEVKAIKKLEPAKDAGDGEPAGQ